MKSFVARHEGKVTAVLDCFDRIVFQGHLPINYPESMIRFLRTAGVTASGYAGFVYRQSEALRLAAEQWAAAEGRPCVFLKTCWRKEAWAKDIAARDGISEGLVAILRTTEMGRSFSVRGGPDRPRLVSAARRGLHLYFYLMDPQLGWIHIRLQTWFPFLIQIAVNGHDILAQHLDRGGIAYERYDNGFTWIEQPERAQTYARRLLEWNWSRTLDRLGQQTNPLLRTLLRGMQYRWVIDQCELSTDLLFDDRASLSSLYPRLVQRAVLCFKADDILGFLGRPLHGLFRGEVFTEHHDREWGLRLKHRVGKNWIKMYNKGGSILRVETVINHPQDFRVLRAEHHLQGFRNEHIRTRLHPAPVTDPSARKRQSAKVRRQLLVLRGHGLLRRIPRTRRYRVTDLGARLITAALYYDAASLPDRLMSAAT